MCREHLFTASKTLGTALAVLALAFDLGCSRAKEERAKERTAEAPSASVPATVHAMLSKPPQPAPRRPYNVLLIIIDSLRYDMPWAGYERDIAPWLTAFAKKSVTYTHGYSISSYTAKSVGGLLVGRYPSEMQRDGMFFTRWFDNGNVFVSERLKKAGRRTFAGHAHGYFLPAIGNNQGFDDWRLLPGGVDIKAVTSVTSERLTKLANEMLSDPQNVRQDGGQRFFGYFHYMDPHHTYEYHKGHPAFGSTARDLYDNEVHFTDSWVGKLLDWTLQQPFAQNTAVIITADHGEGFGEHLSYRHGWELWESLIRVPIIIHVPGAEPRQLDVRRSHIDLAPTILDLMGVPVDPDLRGKSLVPELFGDKPEARRIVADLPRCTLQDRRRAIIDENGHKIIAFGDDVRFELYNLAVDPEEKTDLAKKDPEMLEKMKAVYFEESKKIPLVEVIGGANLKGAPRGRKW